MDIEALLWGQFGCSLLAFLVVFCTPAAPPTPPSGAAHVHTVAMSQPASGAWRCFCHRAIVQLGSSRAALALSLTGGMFFGLMYAWLAGAGGRFNLGALGANRVPLPIRVGVLCCGVVWCGWRIIFINTTTGIMFAAHLSAEAGWL